MGAFAQETGGSGNPWFDWPDFNTGNLNLANQINCFKIQLI